MVIIGFIFLVATYFTQLVSPNYLDFANPDTATFEIARQIGGSLFSSIFLAAIIIGQLASGISCQSSGARLLFAMGRDSVLPKKVFGYVHPKFKTPMFNIILIGLTGLIALLLSVKASTSFINFGAFTTFIMVNISVIAHYYIRERKRSSLDTLLYLIIPILAVCVDVWLWFHLDKSALILGFSWLAVGFVYLLFLTKLFKKQPPEFITDA